MGHAASLHELSLLIRLADSLTRYAEAARDVLILDTVIAHFDKGNRITNVRTEQHTPEGHSMQ